jgi:hypothetical protein
MTSNYDYGTVSSWVFFVEHFEELKILYLARQVNMKFISTVYYLVI